MTDPAPDMSDIDISFGQPHYDHQRAAYFIPEFEAETDSVTIEWPLRDEWEIETEPTSAFTTHYEEFCEPAPEDVFEEPLQVVLQFAFNEYESLRTRLGGGHSYGLSEVDRVSDLGVALRLVQKERNAESPESELDQ